MTLYLQAGGLVPVKGKFFFQDFFAILMLLFAKCRFAFVFVTISNF